MSGASDGDSRRLERVLGLKDLLVYGMIIMQVVAPLPIFGLLEQRSNDHAVATVLLAMVPMIITAVSYGRMAVLYPMVGSAYSYVGRALSPHLGFLVGWSMLLDYVMIPLISALIPSLAIQRLMPAAPLPVLTLLILGLMTALNLRGIRATLRANLLLLIGSSAAVAVFLALATQYLFLKGGWSAVISITPLYNPATFDVGTVLRGVSLAAINYIGFDGLTTLAEDSVNPKRDMVRSTVLIVLVTAILSAVELYFLHSVLPDWRLADPNTSYLEVMSIVGGPFLLVTFLIVMSVSQVGAGFSVQVSGARLLYAMGRDQVLPRSVFGHLSSRQNPSLNILIVGAVAFLASIFLTFDAALDLINFGAFLGYMGVNISIVYSYFIHPPLGYRRSVFWDLLLPASGFVGCLIFWLGLPARAKVVGSVWLLIGLAFYGVKTRGFRERPRLFDLEMT